jgi:hypothetical protein
MVPKQRSEEQSPYAALIEIRDPRAPLLGAKFDASLADVGLLIGRYFTPGVALSLPGGAIGSISAPARGADHEPACARAWRRHSTSGRRPCLPVQYCYRDTTGLLHRDRRPCECNRR